MSTTVTILVLVAALFHALWNAFVKKGSDPLVSIAGIALACGFFSALLIPFVGFPNVDMWPIIIVSICIHTIYMIALSQAYRYGDFSLAYPIARGTAPAIVVVVSLLFLNESFDIGQLISIGGILFGIFLFALRRFGDVIADKRSLAYALITAVLIAAYTLLDGYGARRASSALNYVAWTLSLQAFPIFLYMLYRNGNEGVLALKKNAISTIGGGFMALTGYGIVLWAMTQAPIALVATLRETSIIIAALIGMFWMKEPGGWRRIAAAIIIFMSVVYLKVH